MQKNKKSLGHGFGDEWKDTLLPNFDPGFGGAKSQRPWRIISFYILCLGLFFILFLRLFHLQVVSGRQNRELADGNRIQIKIIHAPRGVIFDRSGKILAANSPAFRLFDPTTKKSRLISREQALALEVKNDPSFNSLEVDSLRQYPLKEKLAHLVGYVGEISETDLKDPLYSGYHQGDRVGKSGIEYQYEKVLRGKDGGEIIEVDSQGKKLRTLRVDRPVAGQNIYLTIDADLQDQIYQQFAKDLPKVNSCCGAAVAMNPSNGQILALVSWPSFDPNIFTNAADETAISSLLTRSDSPLLNRAIGGTYPPGSTFKIISSLAALESGKITPNTIYQDNGVMNLGPYTFSNWYFSEYGRTEGPVNLLKAIQRSNDIYFYNVGQVVGETYLGDWARKLGMGKPLGIDLPGEASGLIPTDKWKEDNFHQVWYPGDTLHMAIGQGFVLATPLQILGITSFMASGGILFQPQLVLKITSDQSTVSQFKPKVLIEKQADPKNIALVKQGLELVPKFGGTAWPFFTFPIPTAGKTGTAEFGDPKNRTHAWYTSFAPATDPKIVMTVLVEAGGEGSTVAGPIAKEVYRWYLSPDKNNLVKDLGSEATASARTLGE